MTYSYLQKFRNTTDYTLPFQQTVLSLSGKLLPRVCSFDKQIIALEPHPLLTLYHLIERSLKTQESIPLQQALSSVPESLRNGEDGIYCEVWNQATDTDKAGENWGEVHALDDQARLLNVIRTVVMKRWNALSLEKQVVVGSRMEKQGIPLDALPQHTKQLISAMHRSQCLDIPGTEIKVYNSLEKNVETPSCRFHLERKELPKGQIGFINGIQNQLVHAKEHAIQISDKLAQGYNIHCTYSAKLEYGEDSKLKSSFWDVSSGILGQGGTLTPSVPLLLEQWLDFFEKDESSRLLQISHSRGAIEVNNALSLLPEHLKQRVIAINVAPACIMQSNAAYRVVNLVNLLDPIASVALNREMVDSDHTVIVEEIYDKPKRGFNPHSMHRTSFYNELEPLIDTFIRTNDIVIEETL